MNRRDLLKTAIGSAILPGVSAIQATEAAGKFAIIVEIDTAITAEQHQTIYHSVRSILSPAFGDAPILIFPRGMTVRIEPQSACKTSRAIPMHVTTRDAEPRWLIEE